MIIMGRKALGAAVLMAVLFPTGAFNHGPVLSASTLVNDEHRREFLNALLTTVAVAPLPAKDTGDRDAERTIEGITDPRLRGYRTASLPDWQGTSLPLLSISEASSREAFTMGKWPDPILRRPAAPVASSVFRNEKALAQLHAVAGALRDTARKEGAVGLAAQQCGVNASLVFIDGVQTATAKNERSGTVFGSATKEAVRRSEKRTSPTDIAGEGASRYDDRPARPERGLFLVNPRIVHRSPESDMRVWTEQCLVLPPEFRATLLRDAVVTIEYETLECAGESPRSGGATRQITLRGELARCAQHEMDHDDGILIVDHVSVEDLLSVAGTPVMARIEDADGLHTRQRMPRAYARDTSPSTLLPADDHIVRLAMEDQWGYRARVTQVENQRVDNEGTRPWLVPPASAMDDEGGTSAMPAATPPRPSATLASPARPAADADHRTCDADCLEERQRIVERRRAMMKQARSNTKRAEVLELSNQRAGLYGTEFKGLRVSP